MEQAMAITEECQESTNGNWPNDEDQLIDWAILSNQSIDSPVENDHTDPVPLFEGSIETPIQLELPEETHDGVFREHHHVLPIGSTVWDHQERVYNSNGLGRPYGDHLLLINQEKQAMILMNRNNTREFPKAYRRMKNDGTLESPEEAITRVVNQQIQIKNRITGEMYGRIDIGEHTVLGPYQHMGYVPLNQQNAHIEISVLVCHIDTNSLAVKPRDNNTFQGIQFVGIHEIHEDMAGYNVNIYSLLQNLLSN